MKKNMLQLFIGIGLFFSFNLQLAAAKSILIAKDLRTDYLLNPMGLDEVKPRFSWLLHSKKSHQFAQAQTAYRVLVSSSAENLRNNQADMWDSGWIETSAMSHILYAGEALHSDRTYYWKVAIKDERSQISAWSDAATWHSGMLETEFWQAQWIGSAIQFDPKVQDCNIPDPWLRKSFSLSVKPKQAIIHVASVGFHELYVNGQKVGDDVMATAVTDHTKRARYVSYDIAPLLQQGDNVIGIWLGTSWSIHGPYISKDRPLTPIVSAQVALYKNRNPKPNEQAMQVIATDASWKLKNSPSRLLGVWDSNRMGGEFYDANLEDSSWCSVAGDDASWGFATVYAAKLLLSAQKVERNKLVEEITPIAIEKRADGAYRIDMGKNFAGWMSISMKGKAGQQVDILFSEREQEDMTFGLHSAYVFDQTGEGTFKNRFNYSSGRWITLKGLKQAPSLADIKGWLVRTDFAYASTFSCSDSLQNWIYETTKWTYENLSLGGFIVDCPQRERLGYGGDAHATCETGMLNYHTAAFYKKWMEDWRDVSGTEPIVGNMYDTTFARKGLMGGRILNNGILPHTAPTYMGGGGPSWGGIVVTLPWYYYQQYQDISILQENFILIKNWISFLESQSQDGILQRFGGNWDFLGDWLWPGATAQGMNNNTEQNLCFNNMYRIYNLRIALKIAETIGATAEVKRWQEQLIIYSNAVHNRFYNVAEGHYADGSNGNMAVALLAEVVPEELKKGVWQRLENAILVKQQGHVAVGITAGALLFKLLRQHNRHDLLYTMTSQRNYPSWGYMKDNQATSIWEMWEKDLPGHSLLHSSFLYPGAWYIDGLAGIKTGAVGYQEFVVQPPILDEEAIHWVKSSFQSPVGLVECAWRRKDGRLNLSVTIPVNSTAIVKIAKTDLCGIEEIPGRITYLDEKDGFHSYRVKSGSYTF